MNEIHNMEQYLPGSGNRKLTPAEMVFLTRCEIIIRAAMKCQKGELCAAGINCDIMTGDTSCTSALDILITDVPNEIRWTCPSCGNHGVIRNWRKSPVCAASPSSPKAGSRESATRVRVPAVFYPLLDEACDGCIELMIILSMAEVSEATCSFHISQYDGYRLLDMVLAKASAGRDDNYTALAEILKELLP